MSYVLAALSIICVFNANANVTQYFAFPASLEFRYLKSSISWEITPQIDRIHIFRPPFGAGLETTLPPSSEYGIYSSSLEGAIPGMVACVLGELGLDARKITATSSVLEEAPISFGERKSFVPQPGPRVLFVDMTKLETFR